MKYKLRSAHVANWRGDIIFDFIICDSIISSSPQHGLENCKTNELLIKWGILSKKWKWSQLRSSKQEPADNWNLDIRKQMLYSNHKKNYWDNIILCWGGKLEAKRIIYPGKLFIKDCPNPQKENIKGVVWEWEIMDQMIKKCDPSFISPWFRAAADHLHAAQCRHWRLETIRKFCTKIMIYESSGLSDSWLSHHCVCTLHSV